MQTYVFRENTGRGLIKLSASNHNHAASQLRQLVKDMSEWSLEDFK